MGLEHEKTDASIIMDDDEFNSSFEPILAQKEKASAPLQDRDPHGVNKELQVDFNDVIGEPRGTHSFDKLWIGSHATFELIKYALYRGLTALLAVPFSFVAGILFAVFSCVHIWVAMPLIHSCLVALPSARAIWTTWTVLFVDPLFRTVGWCFSIARVKFDRNKNTTMA